MIMSCRVAANAYRCTTGSTQRFTGGKIIFGHLYDTNYGLSESIGPGCVHLGLKISTKLGL